jgi:hypothetical protein
VNIKFIAILKKSMKETLNLLCEAHGEDALSKATYLNGVRGLQKEERMCSMKYKLATRE